MFCEAYPNIVFFFFSHAAPQLLYYSHIPVFFFSLLLGGFVFYKKRTLDSFILLLISFTFSLWLFFSLMIWTRTDSRLLMFMWSFWYIFYVLIFIFGLYFVYTFIDKKDISLKIKIIWLTLFLPIVFFTPTKYNLELFDIAGCNAIAGKILLGYVYSVMMALLIWTVCVIVSRYKKISDPNLRKQVLFVSLGIFLFLLDFLIASFSGIAETYIKSSVDSFAVEQYGYLGMLVLIGFVVYAIVQYKAFDMKVLAAKVFVVVLAAGISSEFFFIQNTTNMILNGITLVVSIGFGIMLIKSVKLEVERKEQLQTMTDSLAQANDQLRKLDNAKTEFISIASHQLRTPVTAIKGFASLLLEGSYGEISAGVQGALEKMYVSSERLVNLIEDLLNVSRIESGRLTFTFENAKVENILKELYDNFLLIAKAKKFYLDLKLPKEPFPEIKMDAGKIRELVSNFIDNALKYTEKGGATISAEIRENGAVIDDRGFVKAGEKSPYGEVVRITVSDTGIGIPKEEIPFLFRKFSRGKDISRLHVGGTGLGLYVGKAIADAHHGATWVESDGTGKGSRFIIEIPIDSQTA
jgi:signal transduction histidine kinase